jgi:hypothetical protein
LWTGRLAASKVDGKWVIPLTELERLLQQAPAVGQ